MKQQWLLYCQACSRRCTASDYVIDYRGFRICGDSDYCRERIDNLPMFFVETSSDDSFQIDPAYMGKLIRKGFNESKYGVTRVTILNTSHFQYKTNIIAMIEFETTFKESQTKIDDNPKSINHYREKEVSFPEGILQFENRLKDLDPKSLNGESNLTKVRMKRTLKRLRRVYKQLAVGSS